MACAAVDSEAYLRLWRAAGTDVEARAAAEVERYGATSQQVGGQLLRRNDLPENVAVAIESDPTSKAATPIVRLTGFCRRAASLIVATAHASDPTILKTALDALRVAVSIPIPTEDLAQACVEASTTALSAMRRAR